MNMKVHLLRTSYEACRITRWTKEKGVRWHPFSFGSNLPSYSTNQFENEDTNYTSYVPY